MTESRKARRVKFDHRREVNLMAVDGTWRRSCVLVDISDTGAKLILDGPTEVLRVKEFFLVLSTTGLAFRRCELIWVEGASVGVHFVGNDGRKRGAKPQEGHRFPS
jgi:hypothetical protein